ncbi:mini-chromosome maintenance replisome factor (macronuclear) [Tetrahymena thermophila SB210]|uniref:Mini-chromosome maintenance replisome factor n=1 Tax=Tetrahymena thermophila (strain SB210) TaxID=312017 RepID=I7MIR7_TETTS|nr:mini-chromosome maintenance replisome factor [Tetrahymena thermophila SB210]EAR94188.2 mini-chromosome maintenance replisome factor [Tetrahymena thermophila SB210]|eukprot:XP_001014433.2 mini-chromosome maintenance replisome factor [Tetrahymena thermophila SB210]
MDSQQSFAKNIQVELQKRIAEVVKSNPNILSDLAKINDVDIQLDQLLQNKKAICLESLRSLNDLKQADGQLVEFTYMIQSMFNPEMYAIAAIDAEQVKNGNIDSAIEVFKYHDTITSQNLPNEHQDEFNENIVSALGDRQIYYAIPIPNQNKWSKLVGQNKNNQGQEEIGLEKKEAHHVSYQGIQVSSLDDISKYAPKLQQIGLFNYESDKDDSLHAFPCILKYYNQEQSQNPKLNQIVKVTGILSYNLNSLSDENEHEINQQEEVGDDDQYESFDRISYLYPERLIPRIHVLSSQVISYSDIYSSSIKQLSNLEVSTQAQRQVLLEALTKILGNDQISAFYLLMTLISSVNLSKDEKHYGNLFLNLLNTSQKLSSGAKISETLNDFLQSILVYSVSIPFTLKYLNAQYLQPKSSSSGKISYGSLQLPKETKHFIICDETSLQQGQLDQKGVHNVKNMINFFQDLRVPFESEFYKGFVETDVSGVILSDGKGLLYKDIQIKLEEDIDEESKQSTLFTFDILNDNNFLNQIRKYILESKNQALTVQLDEEVANNIQIDFVEKRKQQAKENILNKEIIINQESLERWIQLCRLNAASKLKKIATIEDYLEIKKLEENRIKRTMKDIKIWQQK